MRLAKIEEKRRGVIKRAKRARKERTGEMNYGNKVFCGKNKDGKKKKEKTGGGSKLSG